MKSETFGQGRISLCPKVSAGYVNPPFPQMSPLHKLLCTRGYLTRMAIHIE